MTIPAEFLAELRQRVGLSGPVARRVRLQRSGREHVGLCPFHDDKTPSFTVNDDKAFFHCFGCGAHGDAIDFIRCSEGFSFPEAVSQLAALAGLTVPAPGAAAPERLSTFAGVATVTDSAREIEARRIRVVDWCRCIWRGCEPADGTLAATYLAARGITMPPPPSLRFSPALLDRKSGQVWPTMVAAVQGASREMIGLHRTFLAPDGMGKAPIAAPKKMVGACRGGAVRFAPVAPTVALAEGIETALSLHQARPDLAVWSVLSIGNFAVIDLPEVVREVIICTDADNADPEAAAAQIEKAARRFHDQERSVRIATPPGGFDLNDLLRAPPDWATREVVAA